LKSVGLSRRIKRMVLFVLLACVVLGGTTNFWSEAPGLGSLALIVILVASWASIGVVEGHLRDEEVQARARSEAARLEGARLTANAMQDRIANKLSVTVGYCELLAGDPRLPADLCDQALRAMDGATAAAKTMSELRRLTQKSERTDDLPALSLDIETLAAIESQHAAPRGTSAPDRDRGTRGKVEPRRAAPRPE